MDHKLDKIQRPQNQQQDNKIDQTFKLMEMQVVSMKQTQTLTIEEVQIEPLLILK